MRYNQAKIWTQTWYVVHKLVELLYLPKSLSYFAGVQFEFLISIWPWRSSHVVKPTDLWFTYFHSHQHIVLFLSYRWVLSFLNHIYQSASLCFATFSYKSRHFIITIPLHPLEDFLSWLYHCVSLSIFYHKLAFPTDAPFPGSIPSLS